MEKNIKKTEWTDVCDDKKVEWIRGLYKEMISDSTTDKRRNELVDEFMKLHQPDGSFSTIRDYRIDSDIVVYYGLIPTYCVTAALVFADLRGIGTAKSKKAMLEGLKFAAEMRGFIGHGFDAINDLIEAIDIYKAAGIYEWIKKNEGKAPEFQETLEKRIMEMKVKLAEGNVYGGWSDDYTEDYTREVNDYEAAMYDYVWYVSYGSNLSRERFMRYINRCTDKSEPLADEARTYDYRMYFASKSSIWGNGKGGSAFIDPHGVGMTYCRAYKIKRSQFEQVMEMEGPKYSYKVDLDPKMEGGIPCYTFTAPELYEETNAPSKEYFDTILIGLKEMYPEKTETFLRFYLLSRSMTYDALTALMQIRCSAHAMKNVDVKGIRTKKRHMDALKSLEKLGLIQVDGRSVKEGLRITDYEALVYTVKEARELIDMLLIGASM